MKQLEGFYCEAIGGILLLIMDENFYCEVVEGLVMSSAGRPLL